LRYAYVILAKEVRRDARGAITELVCTYDPQSAHGATSDGRKVKGIVHWVSAEHAIEAPLRLYDHLFAAEHPDDVPEGVDWKANLNPKSLEVVEGAKLEPSLKDARPGAQYQFERVGYFVADAVDSKPGRPVFNRTAALRDTWAKIEKK
jgi:glutaminyl-tRNA synthetase